MKIPCSIIRELLPNYIDGCIEDDASHHVLKHLEECEGCKTLYEDMKKPMECINEIELDYLKKIRKKNYRRVITVVAISIVVVISGIWISSNYLMNQAIEGNITIDEVTVEQGKVILVAHYASTSRDLDNISITENDGSQGIKFTTTKVEHNTGGSAKRFEIKLKDIDEYIYWEYRC